MSSSLTTHRKCHNLRKHPCADHAELWALRILLDLQGWRGLSNSVYLSTLIFSRQILQRLGIEYLEDQEIKPSEFVVMLEKRQRYIETRAPMLRVTLKKIPEPL